MIVKIFFLFLLLLPVFIILTYHSQSRALRIILILFLLMDCGMISYMGYNFIKYNSAEGLSTISIEFRKKYLEIEDAIDKNPSYKTIGQLNIWNNDVKDMQKSASIWMIRDSFDWREINPIEINKDITDKLIRGEYKLHKYKIVEMEESV